MQEEEAQEEAVTIGGEKCLVGIVTTPPASAMDVMDTAVLLLNAGRIHRVGPSRLYVAFARRGAALGFSACRFDFSGIGDSIHSDQSVSFYDRATRETRQVMDFLHESRGTRKFILLGISSGASAALRVAGHDPRVVGVVSINLDPVGLAGPEAESSVADERQGRYLSHIAIFNHRSWWKAFTGRADYRRIARIVARQLWDMCGRPLGRRPKQPGVTMLAASLRDLVARSVHVLLISSEGDTGFAYFRVTSDASIRAFRSSGLVTVAVIPGSDHTFTLVKHQEQVRETIGDWAAKMTSSSRSCTPQSNRPD